MFKNKNNTNDNRCGNKFFFILYWDTKNSLRYFLNIPALVMLLISLSLIKLFPNTGAEYLRDLIPELVVFI